MPCKDLREYLEVLDKAGELVRITEEVDWYLEAGAIARRAQDLRAMAPASSGSRVILKGSGCSETPSARTRPVVHGRISGAALFEGFRECLSGIFRRGKLHHLTTSRI